ncbi:13708_t:CDS:2, partial [Cetraspora pellucida]
SNIDGKTYHQDKTHKHKPSKTCTITDVSTETATSIITCSTETPTLISCPDNKQTPNDCDSCKTTIITTCTPTTTICAPTSISEDACCSDNGKGRNGLAYDSAQNLYFPNDTITTLEGCCRACYEDPICVAYYLVSTCFLATYSDPTLRECSSVYENAFPAGAVGCGSWMSTCAACNLQFRPESIMPSELRNK